MSIPVVLWIVIAAALAILYAYRRIVAGGSDEFVHVSDVSDEVLSKQAATARSLQKLDRIAMVLAIVLVVYGVALAGLQVYQALSSNA
jgi:hypothetical protein